MSSRLFVVLAIVGSLALPSARGESGPNQPLSLYRDMIDGISLVGIGVLPGSFQVPGMPPDRLTLMRADGIVGQVSYTEDPAQLSSHFAVYDTEGRVLVEADQKVIPCPPGRCTVKTLNDALDGSRGRAPDFEMVLRPTGTSPIPSDADASYTPYPGLAFYRFGIPVNARAYTHDMEQTVGWLRNYFAKTRAVAYKTTSPEEAAYLALLTDPRVARLLPGLTFVADPKGVCIIGTVPSKPSYDLLVYAVLRAGIPLARMDVSILTPIVSPDGYPTGSLFRPAL